MFIDSGIIKLHKVTQRRLITVNPPRRRNLRPSPAPLVHRTVKKAIADFLRKEVNRYITVLIHHRHPRQMRNLVIIPGRPVVSVPLF